MQHRMAVRTNRPKVEYRIQRVLLPDLTKWLDVMNMNEPLANGTVLNREVDRAYDALAAPMLDAHCERAGVARSYALTVTLRWAPSMKESESISSGNRLSPTVSPSAHQMVAGLVSSVLTSARVYLKSTLNALVGIVIGLPSTRDGKKLLSEACGSLTGSF